MKKFLNLYRTFKTPIRVCFFGFVLIAIGYFIKNENVNLFYTFRSPIVLLTGELAFKMGELIIMNLPLIFMLAGVTKKAHNTSVVATALIGYFTFLVTTMLFGTQTLTAQAYSSGSGINSLFNIATGTRLPFETGLFGSLAVAYVTRISFVLSRYRSGGSVLHLFSKETTGFMINIILCFLLGTAVAYVYPLAYNLLQKVIVFVAGDLLDPFRIALYSVLDRVLSLFGLGNLARYPFWYSSLGGSFSNTTTGQVILGDVNIWNATKNFATNYMGAGRYTTFYYVINIFIIPSLYFGILTSVTDKREKMSLLLIYSLGIIMSVFAGNPLPLEMLLLVTAPALYLLYLFVVAVSSGSLTFFGAFLGFSPVSTNTIVATPGCLADLMVNIRNVSMATTVLTIIKIGLLAFVAMFIIAKLYFKYFTIDFSQTGILKEISTEIVDAVSGLENIKSIETGLFKINLEIEDPEIVSFEKLRKLDVGTIYETRNGFTIECGAASLKIKNYIKKMKASV